jgi:hypothetical protein
MDSLEWWGLGATHYSGVTSAYKTIGTHTINTKPDLMGAFWSNIAQTSTGGKRDNLDKARMQLLQQLVAAILNNAAFGSSPSTSIGDAITAFSSTNQKTVKDAASAMASFNEMYDGGVFATPQGSADGGKYAKDIANLAFWDVLP